MNFFGTRDSDKDITVWQTERMGHCQLMVKVKQLEPKILRA